MVCFVRKVHCFVRRLYFLVVSQKRRLVLTYISLKVGNSSWLVFCTLYLEGSELCRGACLKIMKCVDIGPQAYTAPEYMVWFSCFLYNFASMGVCLWVNAPYSMVLKIWFSNGCGCIRKDFLIEICMRSGITVTNL